jgi:hypothetical protein
MKLYIKLLNGKPVDHPYVKENMETAYPDVDLDNLPENWAEFVRILCPKLGPYQSAEVAYEWDGDVVKDVWYVHDMSEEEKAQKQQRVKNNWKDDNGFPNWIFDEDKCCHVPPVPMPQDGKGYKWVQEAEVWVEVKIPPSVLSSRPPYPVTDPLDTRKFLWNETTSSWDQMP